MVFELNIVLPSVIIEIDLDDDFKLDAKKFRTPGSAQVSVVRYITLSSIVLLS